MYAKDVCVDNRKGNMGLLKDEVFASFIGSDEQFSLFGHITDRIEEIYSPSLTYSLNPTCYYT
jgi:hypothetical protein